MIDANPTQFYLDFKDYDFDGHKDIYLQRSASNGWSLSRGCLIIVNPQTKKLMEHKEANNLANMNPDFENKIIVEDRTNLIAKAAITLEKPAALKPYFDYFEEKISYNFTKPTTFN